MQNILLKDQFIFGVTVHEIQEHLLNDIEDDHDLNHCLQEARKIESHIDKRPQSRSQSGIRDYKYCSTNHQHQQCPTYSRTCKS